jgi:hypothetical protein
MSIWIIAQSLVINRWCWIHDCTIWWKLPRVLFIKRRVIKREADCSQISIFHHYSARLMVHFRNTLSVTCSFSQWPFSHLRSLGRIARLWKNKPDSFRYSNRLILQIHNLRINSQRAITLTPDRHLCTCLKRNTCRLRMCYHGYRAVRTWWWKAFSSKWELC